jgi:flagellar export protein FliJ
MKRYSFPLERVLDWKTLVAEREQLALETLHQQQEEMTSSLLNLSNRIEELASDTQTAESGHELAYTAQARSSLIRTKAKAERDHADGAARIASQQVRFRTAETERRLMDKLKDRSLESWSAELARETDATAADLYLGSWNRR